MRKTKYDTHVAPFLYEIGQMARNGATEEEIAKKLSVAYSTFREYKRKHKELEKALETNRELPALNVKIAVVNREPKPCYKVGACKDCEFKPEPSCFLAFTDWLMSEYKPEQVLTEREKGFVECIEDGWISRDSDGILNWSNIEPIKFIEDKRYRFYVKSSHTALNKDYFPFITWEDEEPWSVEELRKLKVADE